MKAMPLLVLLPLLLLAACGDDAPARKPDETPGSLPLPESFEPPPPPVDEPPPEPEPVAPDDPAQIGKAVATLYANGLETVVTLLKERPEPVDAKAAVQDLHDMTVEALVALGRKREALDEEDRGIVDREIRLAMARVPKETFEAFTAAHKHYMALDRETANLIASFNVITQYAIFELLRKQEPEEAKRLGVDGD